MTVVHCKHSEYDVLIDRTTKWGNPFVLDKGADDQERAHVIGLYARWIMDRPDLIEAAKTELRGKVLGCWCAPRACHGDVLEVIANG